MGALRVGCTSQVRKHFGSGSRFGSLGLRSRLSKDLCMTPSCERSRAKRVAEKRPRERYKLLIGKPGKNPVFDTPLTGDARHVLDENNSLKKLS